MKNGHILGLTPATPLDPLIFSTAHFPQELYSQRSKLLRFVEGEWKERGTGDAKILRHGGWTRTKAGKMGKLPGNIPSFAQKSIECHIYLFKGLLESIH